MSSTDLALLIDPRALAVPHPAILPMSDEAIAAVYRFEDRVLELEQHMIFCHHLIHGGMYHRTGMVRAGDVATGALVKVPTTLTIVGSVEVVIGDDEPLRLNGYNVIPAAAGRKQAFKALTDTVVTMAFATKAKTVDEAEREFTDEFHRLMSNSDPALNRTTITGG